MSVELPNKEQFGSPVDIMRLAIAFKRRHWGIVGATIFGAIAGVGASKTLVPPVFEARSVIECDRCISPDFGDRELATLQETVKLPAHLEIARQHLGLEGTLERIGRDIDVNASIESRLIQITGHAKTADMAAGMANVIVDALLETRLHVEWDKLTGRLRMLEGDAENARKALTDAREQYDQFRTDNKIADLPAERLAAIQEAARLRSESAIARGETAGEYARARALQRVAGSESAMAVLHQTEDLPEARRLAAAKSDLSRARSRFSADHPSVLALETEVNELERKVGASSDGVTTEIVVGPNPQWQLARHGIIQATAGQEAAETREMEYEQLAQAAAQAAARLTGIEGRASELLSNLTNAERHLAAVEVDKKIAEDAARSPSTGLRILAPAQPPSIPIKSSRRIAALLGPIFGCILAAFATVLYELRGFRIRTAEELAFWGQGPVLASSQWPTSEDALDDLVWDIVGAMRTTKGKTILIGASPNEAEIVQLLAESIQEEMNGVDFDESSIEALTDVEGAGALRRAVRAADRVVICVSAGRYSAFELRAFVNKLAFSCPIGFVLVDLYEEHASLPDLAGDAKPFWNAAVKEAV